MNGADRIQNKIGVSTNSENELNKKQKQLNIIKHMKRLDVHADDCNRLT